MIPMTIVWALILAFFGFTADSHAAPEVDRMEKFLRDAFSEMEKAAGTGATKQPRKPRRRAKSEGKGTPVRGEAKVEKPPKKREQRTAAHAEAVPGEPELNLAVV